MYYYLPLMEMLHCACNHDPLIAAPGPPKAVDTAVSEVGSVLALLRAIEPTLTYTVSTLLMLGLRWETYKAAVELGEFGISDATPVIGIVVNDATSPIDAFALVVLGHAATGNERWKSAFVWRMETRLWSRTGLTSRRGRRPGQWTRRRSSFW